MGKIIKMGNDEFILYVRKQNSTCKYDTKKLGELICKWLKEHAGLEDKNIEYDRECLWGEHADNVSPDKLPKTASQFEFDRDKLPAYMIIWILYNHWKIWVWNYKYNDSTG